jgi:flagellar biosynthesis regulator FlaF
MNTDSQRVAELRNDAIRCNNRLRFVVTELSACVQRNHDLNEKLKDRRLTRRFSDAFNGKERSIRDEIRQNTVQINAYLLEALQEVNERNRINLEALSYVNRISTELREIVDECVVSKRSARPSRETES